MKKLIMMFLVVISLVGCEFVTIETIPRGGDYSDYEWELPEEIEKFFDRLDKQIIYFSKSELDINLFYIKKISKFINNNISYADDNKIWNYKNVWQLPETTWNLKTGDCEDMSILTMYLVCKYLGIKGGIGRCTKGNRKNICHAIFILNINNISVYIDQNKVVITINELAPYKVKEIVSYGEALWIADTMESEYKLL